MSTGSFRLAEQMGGWAVYADITVCITRGTGERVCVEFDETVSVELKDEYRAAIQNGVAYALSLIPNSQDVVATVQKLHTNPVDTTAMAVTFATCHAVLNCFDAKPSETPYFDCDSRSFVFPARGPTD